MKVRVLQQFKCKIDNKTRFKVGSEHEFETERAQNLIERGLAEAIEDAPTNGKKEDALTGSDHSKGGKAPSSKGNKTQNGKGGKNNQSGKGKAKVADKNANGNPEGGNLETKEGGTGGNPEGDDAKTD